MMSTNVKELLKSRILFKRILAFLIAVVVGSATLNIYAISPESEFPEFTDPIMEAIIPEEEPPLAAAPKVTTTTTKKTTTKNVKLSKAATKTYTSKLPTTKKITTKKTTSSKSTVTTETTVSTAVTEKFTKKSKTKVVTTTVTTTVKTTTVAKATPTPTPKPTYKKYTTTADKLAPKMAKNVLDAYKTLNFTVIVDPNVTYSGYFNSREQSITLNAKQMDSFPDTIYHELGHFLAFVAGNVDTTADFAAIYKAEKGKFTGVNKTYATQSSSEFFAECVRVYYVDSAKLKKECPKTYAAIEKALKAVTDARIQAMKKVYAPYWKY